jgi:hypothetical protein
MICLARLFALTALLATATLGSASPLLPFPVPAQTSSISPDTEIRQTVEGLEEREFQAVLRNDIPTLDALWSQAFTVNNPVNKIVGKQDVMGFMRHKSGLQYSSVKRQSEGMVVRPDMVVSMGYEEVVPVGSDKDAGKTVTRRYTNVWYLESGAWKLLARQATVISVK